MVFRTLNYKKSSKSLSNHIFKLSHWHIFIPLPGDPSALGLRPVVRGLAAARSVSRQSHIICWLSMPSCKIFYAHLHFVFDHARRGQ